MASRVQVGESYPVDSRDDCLVGSFSGRIPFEESTVDNAFLCLPRVLIGLGGICFSLFSIVSILESGTSSK